MSKLLLLGHSPLPQEHQQLQCAANLRTWHLAKPLLDDGHELRLVAARIHESYPTGTAEELEVTTEEEGLRYFSVDQSLFHDPGYIQKHHDEFCPDAILGINTYPSSRAVEIVTDCPIWCDLNGWIMAEAQTKAAAYDDDRYLSHFWNMERQVLDRADVMSTVSQAQANALIGELALRGRLSRLTIGYEFSRHIPNALVEVEYEHRFNVIRGKLTPEDAFVVLWVGGYNTWTDVDLLFEALESAMNQLPSLHFVSTGGALKGHDDLTFERFRSRIEASAFRERVHFAGWVPTEEVPSFYFESDLGISVDNVNYETVFGARNRLNDMLKVRLPILTTLGTEISCELAERNLALTVEIGDSQSFAEQIVWAFENQDELRSMGAAASDYGREAYSYEVTTSSLVAWARRPLRAPDLGERLEFDPMIDFFKAPVDATSLVSSEPSPTESSLLSERCHDLEVQLDAIHRSKMWRFWMAYLKARSLVFGRPVGRSEGG